MLWKQKQQRNTPDSDEVAAIPALSNVTMLTRVILHTMFVFDEIIDPISLGNALEKLARREGWRKLGSRLRKSNTTGKIEFQIPTAYSDKRSAITRKTTEYQSTMGNHDVASQLPRASQKPALLANVDDYKALWMAPGDPKDLDDLLTTDRSAFSVHIHKFADGTVLVFHWSHALFDAMGLAAVLRALLLVLRNKEDELQTPLSHMHDPLRDCQKKANPDKPYLLDQFKLGTFDELRWALRNVGELAVRRQEVRTFCVPAGLVEKLRAKALQELKTNVNETPMPFLSESDILTAWLARLINSERPPSKPILLMNIFDLRKVFKGSYLPPDKFYLANCVSAFNVLTSTDAVLEKPLSYTAAQIRAAIVEQTTLEQTEAYLGSNSKKRFLPPLFGDSSVKLTTFSNWARAGFFDLDFSPALQTQNKEPRMAPVTPRYIQDKTTPYHIIPVIILGKDASGNYWSTVTLNSKRWKAFERAMEYPLF